MTAQEVFEALASLGGVASMAGLGEVFGGYEGGAWTSPRLFLRLRDLIRALRAERQIAKVGEKRTARYVVLRECRCGHPRADHVFDDLNPLGECCVVTRPGGGMGSDEFCDCSEFVGRLPESVAISNPSADEPEGP